MLSHILLGERRFRVYKVLPGFRASPLPEWLLILSGCTPVKAQCTTRVIIYSLCFKALRALNALGERVFNSWFAPNQAPVLWSFKHEHFALNKPGRRAARIERIRGAGDGERVFNTPISVYRLGEMPIQSRRQSVSAPRRKAGARLNAHTE
jgi:hypothetical protein